MQPENFYFGGGTAETMMHPIVLVAMILSILFVLVLPRKYLIVPFLCSAILIPMTQTLVIGGVHFFALRIIMLFAWIRIAVAKFSSSEKLIGGGLGALDIAFLLWALLRTFTFLLRFSLQAAPLINQAGFLWDVLGAYFILRYAIQDHDDIRMAIKTLAIVASILAVCVLNEKFRYQNIFGYLGGIPVTPGFREGSVRPMGPFSHALLMGAFGATLLPLCFWLWNDGKSRMVSVCGAISSTIITMASASSTPLMAYAAGVFAMCLWPLRKRMRPLRWGIVIGLIGLQLVMKAPVWFLITHIEVIGASSGYHRAMLIDQFVRHFGDWWLIGTNMNADWGWDMWDLSNQFVAEGEAGGLATLLCFIAVISICFSWIGKARKASEGDRTKEWSMWLLGAAMFSHVVAFFGVSYWDHMHVVWMALLSIIAVGTIARVAQPSHDEVVVPRPWLARALPSRLKSPEPAVPSRRSYSHSTLRSRRLS
jgi:hypothetical protein